MPREIIQNSFQAGEVSPQMRMRTDLNALRHSIKQGTNWRLKKQGPVITRPVTEKATSVTESTAGAYSVFGSITWNAGGALAWLISGDSATTDGALYRETVEQSITINDHFREDSLRDATLIQPPGLNELWVFMPNRAPYKIYIVSGVTWGVQDLSFTNGHSSWTTGTPPKGVNAACIFQNRLYVAGVGDYGHQMWASKTGDFLDFTTGSLPDDAFTYELSDAVQIQWMRGMANLLIGTDTYEYIMSAQEGVLMTGDVQSTIQSNYGSYGNALSVGIGVLYRSIDQKQLKVVKFNYVEDQWISRDLLFASEHLTEDATIVDMAYHPLEERIYCVLSDGRLIEGLYNAIEGTAGWTPVELFENAVAVHVHKTSLTEYKVYVATWDEDEQHSQIFLRDDLDYTIDFLEEHTATAPDYIEEDEEKTRSELASRTDIMVVCEDLMTVTEMWDSDSSTPVENLQMWDWRTNGFCVGAIESDGGGGYQYGVDGNLSLPEAPSLFYIPINAAGDFTEDMVVSTAYTLAFDLAVETSGSMYYHVSTAHDVLTGDNCVVSKTEVAYSDGNYDSYSIPFTNTSTGQLYIYFHLDTNVNIRVQNLSLLRGATEIWESDSANPEVEETPYSWEEFNGSEIITDDTSGDYYYQISHTQADGYVRIPISAASDFSGSLVQGEDYRLKWRSRMVTTAPGAAIALSVKNLVTDGFGDPNTLIHQTPLTEDTTWVERVYDFTHDGTTDDMYIYLEVINSRQAYSLRIDEFSLTYATESTDFSIHKDQSADGSGVISCPAACQTMYTGLPYTGTLETRNLAEQVSEGSDNTHRNRKRMNKAFIRVIDSYPLTIEGIVPKTFTKGDQDIQVTQLGWERDQTLTLVQDSGYKTEIAGIFGSIGEGKV